MARVNPNHKSVTEWPHVFHFRFDILVLFVALMHAVYACSLWRGPLCDCSQSKVRVARRATGRASPKITGQLQSGHALSVSDLIFLISSSRRCSQYMLALCGAANSVITVVACEGASPPAGARWARRHKSQSSYRVGTRSPILIRYSCSPRRGGARSICLLSVAPLTL